MSSGEKPADSGSKIIQVRTKDTGIVLWEADISQSTPLHSTITYQEAGIQAGEQIILISIQCVPSTMLKRVQRRSRNTGLGSEVDRILQEWFDVIKDEESA